jgi:hypothetical protein
MIALGNLQIAKDNIAFPRYSRYIFLSHGWQSAFGIGSRTDIGEYS